MKRVSICDTLSSGPYTEAGTLSCLFENQAQQEMRVITPLFEILKLPQVRKDAQLTPAGVELTLCSADSMSD